MSYLRYLCLLTHSGVKHVFIIWWGSYNRQELLIFGGHPGPARILVGSMLFIFVFFCAVSLCLVCLRPVSCVPNVASVSWLIILDYPFGFI